MSGTDPFSGIAIPPYQTYTLGSAPVIIFGNNSGTMGTAPCVYPTNILAKTATKLWSGQIGTAQETFGQSVCNANLAVNQREPVSGAYNVLEFQLVHARDGNSSDTQEENGALNTPIIGNPPSGNCNTPPFTAPYTCTNPLVLSSGLGSIRFRAISTLEMVNAVNGTTPVLPPAGYQDHLGYAFYSLGSFFSATNANVRYFTLQGVDPLYANYNTGGAFGTCAGSIAAGTFKCTTALPNFGHVMDGSYRLWSIYRWVAPPNLPGTDIRMQLLAAGTDQAHFALTNPGANGGGMTCSNCVIKAIANFIPTGDLAVFRSHYNISGLDANNGTTSPATGFCAADQNPPNCPEEGGDMAGIVLFKVTDMQYFNATGGEFISQIE